MYQLITNSAIDAFQTSKKAAIDSLVKHEGLAKTLHKFVDTQTEYTKKAADSMFAAGNELYKTYTDISFYKESFKSMQDMIQDTLNTHNKER